RRAVERTTRCAAQVGRPRVGSRVIKVKPGAWVPTGVHLKKGQSVKITAEGKCTSPDGKTTWEPGGYFALNFRHYNLKAKIGKDIQDVNASGTVNAAADGDLMLGITDVYEPKADDSKIQGF